jgi:uncharacterized membrane protein
MNTFRLKMNRFLPPLTYSVFLTALILFVFSMSFFVWMNESLRLDEAQSVWQTSRSLQGVMYVIAKDVHVPFYFVGLHFWEIFFGTSEFAIRFFSLIFFLAAIPVMFYLAREVYSDKVAYPAAILTAVSPFLNWYGSEARMYSMLFLLSTLSHLFFMRLWRKPTFGAWTGFALVTIIGLFTHLFFAFLICSQILFYIIYRNLFEKSAFGRFSVVALITGFLIVVWFVFRHLAGAGLTDPLLQAPTSVDFFNVFSNFFIGFQSDRINTFVLSLWPFLVFIAFTFIARKKEHEPETWYLCMSAFVPIILAFAVSAVFQPLFLSRYLIICLPAIYLLAVYFLSTYKGYMGEIALVILVAVMFGMLAIQAIHPYTPVKEDYRSASAYVEKNATAEDIFVVSAPFITYPVEYYYHGESRLVTFPKWERYSEFIIPEKYTPELMEARVNEYAAVYEDMFLLLGYDQGYEEEFRLYMDTHYQRTATETFSPGLTLYVYKLRYI